MKNRQLVDALLAQYQEYKVLSQKESELSRAVAKQKLKGTVEPEIAEHHATTKQQLTDLSDAMKFANPIVWMTYKFEAYKNEAQPILTMNDFRVHCSKPGYICTKRFEFLNSELLKRGFASLADSATLGDDVSLNETLASADLVALSADKTFQEQWDTYEHHTIGGKTAKWENYPTSEGSATL